MTVIAIDGPAAAGKGTLARALAAHYGFAYLDTGTLYRAVARAALDTGTALDDAPALARLAERLQTAALDDPALRSEHVGGCASKVAMLAPVRAALVDLQRRFAAHPPGGEPGAVLDGRDIGTAICPGAEVKLYVTASVEARAQRRLREQQTRGARADLAALKADIAARDRRDAGRRNAPLSRAADAHLLDTTDLSIEAAVEQAKAVIDQALGAAAVGS